MFDGAREEHGEDEPFSPLGVYGQTKAAGDIAVANCPRHYIVRSSWVIGDGKNFVRTMAALSDRCADPDDALNRVTVVNDQFRPRPSPTPGISGCWATAAATEPSSPDDRHIA